MPSTPQTEEEIRAEKLEVVKSINRMLNRGVSEVRESSGDMVKRSLSDLRKRRDELLAETGGIDAVGPVQTGRIRQVRMIGYKGY